MKASALPVAAAALLALACGERSAAPAPSPDVRYDGATTISRRLFPELVPLVERQSGVKLVVHRSGTGIGLRRLFQGEVDVAGVARRLTADELARKPYFQIIGYDALGIWVHASSPVKGLTRAQLKAIFTGAATSWRAFGGRDLPIRPCTERLASQRATLEAVRMVMDGAPYGRVKELEDPGDCLAWVAETPGAIAAATMTFQVPGTRALAVDGLEPSLPNVRSSRYLLTRPLLLVSREPPRGPLAELFEAALSPEGQAIVARQGFVPAR